MPGFTMVSSLGLGHWPKSDGSLAMVTVHATACGTRTAFSMRHAANRAPGLNSGGILC